MNRSSIRKKATLAAVALLIALVFKYHYSTSTVNDLQWVLAPTSYLVEIFSGLDFRFESYSGYLSEDRTFLIAASCSGVNFLIIAFLMLAACALLRPETKWYALPLALAGAYATTILANTTRIVIALQTLGADTGISWLGFEELHRIEGIAVYFGFLILLFFAAETLISRRSVDQTTRLLPIPLAIYYICTLAIPLATGAHDRASFWTHSLFVALVPMLIVVPIAALAFGKPAARRSHR